MEGEEVMRFLSILLTEHLSWKENILKTMLLETSVHHHFLLMQIYCREEQAEGSNY